MKKYALLLAMAMGITIAIGQTKNDTINLSQVEVVSPANETAFKNVSRDIRIIQNDEIRNSPVASIDELLRIYGGVDIRSRGPMGVQSDVNLRGGTFDQGLIMINGIPLNDPQTGHHNLNQTIDLNSIERVEIIEGPGARWLGTNSFAGGINLISEISTENNFEVSLKGGQYGYISLSGSGNYGIGRIRNKTIASYSGSDGYTTNTDFSIINLNHQMETNIGEDRISLNIGLLDKGFGANSFYTSKYPDQYEHIRTYSATASYRTEGIVKLSSNIFWRQNNDRFELFREDKNWYVKQGDLYINGSDTAGYPTPSGLYPYAGHNYHKTNTYGVDMNLSFQSKFGETSLGTTFKSESILSNVLGKTMNDTVYISGSDGFFTKSDRRNYADIKLNQFITLNRFTISAGVAVLIASEYGTSISPGVDLGYFITEKVKVFANANRAMRLPTFTDLYYQGPTNIANPDLNPERATSYEAGIAYLETNTTISLAGNYRSGKDIIDWVRYDSEEKWQSTNLASIETYGLTFRANHIFQKGIMRNIALSYAWLSSDKTNPDIISLYALDYLKHNFNIVTSHGIFSGLNASWTFTLQQRNGSYIEYETGNQLNYSTVALLNLKLYYNYKNFQISFTANNILNKSYYDIGNIKQPGIWIYAGLSYNILGR